MKEFNFGAGASDPVFFPTDALAEAAVRAINQAGENTARFLWRNQEGIVNYGKAGA